MLNSTEWYYIKFTLKTQISLDNSNNIVYCTTVNMESAMKTTGFGYFLRDTRENAKISLRKLAQETKLDPA